ERGGLLGGAPQACAGLSCYAFRAPAVRSHSIASEPASCLFRWLRAHFVVSFAGSLCARANPPARAPCAFPPPTTRACAACAR
ncbi:hypothetical protein, partial [Helicobacter felis]|uniref:hypothetical protein n=1 Tax=Helicobacter felis TaxID=214 RepID=UPI001F3FD672